ncbi:MAG: cation:proton antiporter subunit C [Candidatus Bipolaricaulis anaerobius]|nr:cation:proton antiporter subunit C [Candidatus Bipolaricaulis sp.]MDD5764213.1 cation:proton antiporter subunit C [Candidatus Bipolaricaulis anaerobius]HOD73558.1 cation:proton antiporter subunit C [Candidatus Bipolaricaulis anaerobius]HQM38185.1 cation:proton antiporter subunit C [Candidatus Bipolaricaulis anaerobius]
MIGNTPFVVCMILVALGLWALLFRRNLVKIVIGLTLIENGVNLFLVATGYVQEGVVPIYTYAPPDATMVLPTPQALTLTSIVIGLATTALMLSFAIVIHRHKKTLDGRKMTELSG